MKWKEYNDSYNKKWKQCVEDILKKLDGMEERDNRIERKLDEIQMEMIETKNENQNLKIENIDLKKNIMSQEKRCKNYKGQLRKRKTWLL